MLSEMEKLFGTLKLECCRHWGGQQPGCKASKGAVENFTEKMHQVIEQTTDEHEDQLSRVR